MSEVLDSFPLRPLSTVGDQTTSIPVFFSLKSDRTLSAQVGMDRTYSASDGYTCFLVRHRDTMWTFKNMAIMFSGELQASCFPKDRVAEALEARMNLLAAEVTASRLEAALIALREELNRTFSHPGDLTHWETIQASAWLGDHRVSIPVQHPQPPDDSARYQGLSSLGF